jgi:hypothetical protein
MARYDENNNPYSWMPGFLRRFLNLTYDEPTPSAGSTYSQTSTGSSYSQASYAPPSAKPGWSAPGEPSFKPTNMEGYRPAITTPTAPPPISERPAAVSPASLRPGAPPVQLEGYVQPVLYLLRSYARGALPPQGLEAFSKETRATTTDVWNLYSHWVRFQAEEAFRLGRELLDAVTKDAPASAAGASAPARRIKVTVANGNGDHLAAPPAATDASVAQAAANADAAIAAAEAPSAQAADDAKDA